MNNVSMLNFLNFITVLCCKMVFGLLQIHTEMCGVVISATSSPMV